MKFQYSLRTLIIACFIAGIGVYFGVQAYLAGQWSRELNARANTISTAIDRETSAVLKAYNGKPNYSGNMNGRSFSNMGNRWFSRVEISGRFGQQVVPLFCLYVGGTRDGGTFSPIEIEYDNAAENDALAQKLKALCDEKKWPCVLRKVEKVKE